MIGKILGCYFGYVLTAPMGHGLLGIFFGWWLGSKFDQSINPNKKRSSFYFNYSHTQNQKVFFNATFAVMGFVAKSDGVVSQQEINVAENFMAQLGFSATAKREAIASFNRGKSHLFDLDKELDLVIMNYSMQPILLRMFIDVQNRAASVDGLNREKINLINYICQRLGFDSLYGSSSSRFTQNHSGNLDDAYSVLEVSSSCSDDDLKKAYRKMIGKHHPDRLVAKGLPPEMIKVANQKTIEIKKAYELIKTKRGL